MNENDIVVEPWREGRPREGQVFAAVFAHSDDFTIFSSALIIKLIKEGATGYFIRTSNDELDSAALTPGGGHAAIEKETRDMASFFGIRKVYDFNYKNHYMDFSQLTEIRHRLMFLFRLLKVDTLITFDPSDHYEENPDHYITSLAAEQAAWMAGSRQDISELCDAGIYPHGVSEKYYISRTQTQATNRLIDASPVFDEKVRALCCNFSPLNKMWQGYKKAYEGRDGAITSMEEYARHYFTDTPMKPLCSLEQYESFRYIGPDSPVFYYGVKPPKEG